MEVIRLTLYGKAHCGLCDHAREVVEDVIDDLDGRLQCTLDEVDITSYDALRARFRLDIPVLSIDEKPVFRHRVEYDALVARLLHGTPTPLESAPPEVSRA